MKKLCLFLVPLRPSIKSREARGAEKAGLDNSKQSAQHTHTPPQAWTPISPKSLIFLLIPGQEAWVTMVTPSRDNTIKCTFLQLERGRKKLGSPSFNVHVEEI